MKRRSSVSLFLFVLLLLAACGSPVDEQEPEDLVDLDPAATASPAIQPTWTPTEEVTTPTRLATETPTETATPTATAMPTETPTSQPISTPASIPSPTTTRTTEPVLESTSTPDNDGSIYADVALAFSMQLPDDWTGTNANGTTTVLNATGVSQLRVRSYVSRGGFYSVRAIAEKAARPSERDALALTNMTIGNYPATG